mgnify:CR=1 FL=1
MNNTEFSKDFIFAVYKKNKNYYTDNSKNSGSPSNFLALMVKGNAKIKTRYTLLEINEGDVFFIPKKATFYELK